MVVDVEVVERTPYGAGPDTAAADKVEVEVADGRMGLGSIWVAGCIVVVGLICGRRVGLG